MAVASDGEGVAKAQVGKVWSLVIPSSMGFLFKDGSLGWWRLLLTNLRFPCVRNSGDGAHGGSGLFRLCKQLATAQVE
jgi:hypothetical protein